MPWHRDALPRHQSTHRAVKVWAGKAKGLVVVESLHAAGRRARGVWATPLLPYPLLASQPPVLATIAASSLEECAAKFPLVALNASSIYTSRVAVGNGRFAQLVVVGGALLIGRIRRGPSRRLPRRIAGGGGRHGETIHVSSGARRFIIFLLRQIENFEKSWSDQGE